MSPYSPPLINACICDLFGDIRHFQKLGQSAERLKFHSSRFDMCLAFCFLPIHEHYYALDDQTCGSCSDDRSDGGVARCNYIIYNQGFVTCFYVTCD